MATIRTTSWRDGKWTRDHFFGKYPELLKLVANLTDADLKKLNRGGHDPQKVYAAYHAATSTRGRPTCVLAKTVKGYGMGEAGEGKNPTHQLKKLGGEALKAFRDRYRIPIPDEQIPEAPYYKPADNSPSSRTCSSVARRWAVTCRSDASRRRPFLCRRSKS